MDGWMDGRAMEEKHILFHHLQHYKIKQTNKQKNKNTILYWKKLENIESTIESTIRMQFTGVTAEVISRDIVQQA